MWARVVEFMLGCWLAMSPFIFAHPPGATLQWTVDFTAAVLVMAFALASFARRTRHARFLTLIVAAVLIGIGRFAASHPTPATQNEIIVGLLLLMFAIIPNQTNDPPLAWYRRGAGSRTVTD